jgi:3'(2'), 5'-bisphosphate nucleotidase
MKQEYKDAINASVRAGEAIMKIYEKDFSVDYKDDASPLTEADSVANTIIVDLLSPSGIPVISEEIKQLPYDQRKDWNICWMVDPLDGTKEFIKKNGEFTVNIALIENGLPVFGAVYLPVMKILYFGGVDVGSYIYDFKDGELDVDDLITASIKLPIKKRPDKFTIVASRSHMSPETETFINECKNKYGDVELISKGSSIKLCLVAEGSAHVYPRIAPTMEWDTAAAHAVAKFAGCSVTDFHKETELVYNKENLLNPYFLVAYEG